MEVRIASHTTNYRTLHLDISIIGISIPFFWLFYLQFVRARSSLKTFHAAIARYLYRCGVIYLDPRDLLSRQTPGTIKATVDGEMRLSISYSYKPVSAGLTPGVPTVFEGDVCVLLTFYFLFFFYSVFLCDNQSTHARSSINKRLNVLHIQKGIQKGNVNKPEAHELVPLYDSTRKRQFSRLWN